jgi:hypothetical protein
MSEVGRTRWLRCSLAGLAVFAGTFAMTAVVAFIYAFGLAFEVRGAPDQAKIQTFARAVGSTWGPWMRVVLAFVIAAWVGRSSRSAVLEGAALGLVAAIAGLWLAWPPDTRDLAFFMATTAAALVGALATRRRVPGSGGSR